MVRRGNRAPASPGPNGSGARAPMSDRAQEAVLRARATAYKHIPARGTTVLGETVPGLPGTVLAVNAVNSTELASGSTNSERAVDSPHMKDNVVVSRVLASHNSDDAQRAVSLGHCKSTMYNPGQATPGLRSISDTLGGSSLRAAAGDHSHGSGNSMDFDYLPEAQRRRALRVRQYLRARKGEMFARSGTAGERLVAVENRCEALTFMVLALARCLIDAPDLTAEERQQMRDAGQRVADFFEFRMHEVKGENESFHDKSLPGYANEHPDMGEWVSPVA